MQSSQCLRHGHCTYTPCRAQPTYIIRIKAKLLRCGRTCRGLAPLGASGGNGLSSQTHAVEYYYREPAPWPTDIPLREHDLGAQSKVDVIVAGAGPSGVALAERVAAAGFKVCVIDPNPLCPWPNNYGVWVDEFEAMGLADCLEVVWPQANVYLDSSAGGKKFLRRAYGRVDRPALKKKLLQKCVAHGVTFLRDKVESVCHDEFSSTITTAAGHRISGTLVLDATGHARKLVEYDKKFDPGYQGAYGIIAEVESHPFPTDTMLFMDWRDAHTQDNPVMNASNKRLPTFLYAMPFTDKKIFLEETSLVARPAVEFPELKARLEARMKWLGIKVTKIEEEEYCLIPMGGVLPKHPQRVIGVGGTAGYVHPSTGFMMSRMLGAVPEVADAIVEQLSRPTDRAVSNGVSSIPADDMTRHIWAQIWPQERLRQRAFFNFGMDVLLQLDLEQTRQFFAAFFSLSAFHWHGFLSARLGFAQLIVFGLSLFANSSNEARSNLLMKGLPGLVGMLAGLVPTFTDYYGLEAEKKKANESILDPRTVTPAIRGPLTSAEVDEQKKEVAAIK